VPASAILSADRHGRDQVRMVSVQISAYVLALIVARYRLAHTAAARQHNLYRPPRSSPALRAMHTRQKTNSLIGSNPMWGTRSHRVDPRNCSAANRWTRTTPMQTSRARRGSRRTWRLVRNADRLRMHKATRNEDNEDRKLPGAAAPLTTTSVNPDNIAPAIATVHRERYRPALGGVFSACLLGPGFTLAIKQSHM
jgi:hypothetical protein